MSPVEDALEGATLDHVALSVGSLDAVSSFYQRVGFTEVARSDFASFPVRTARLRTKSGIWLEITEHRDSLAVPPVKHPVEAAQRRGVYHFALHVPDLRATVGQLEGAGARVIVPLSPNSRHDGSFAYVADPEGNLIELVSN